MGWNIGLAVIEGRTLEEIRRAFDLDEHFVQEVLPLSEATNEEARTTQIGLGVLGGGGANLWHIYEQGKRVRGWTEEPDQFSGQSEPHPLEDGAHTGHPADRIDMLFENLVGESLFTPRVLATPLELYPFEG